MSQKASKNSSLNNLRQMRNLLLDSFDKVCEQLTFQGDPLKLGRKIILHKYLDAFSSPFQDPIDAFFTGHKNSSTILYQDYLYYDDQSEYLNKFYKSEEINKNLPNICHSMSSIDHLRPCLILHSQNKCIALRFKEYISKPHPQQIFQPQKFPADELQSFEIAQESDLGPLNSFSNEKDLFGGSDNSDGETETQPKMFASVLDDGQIHNSFQKLLERHEEMADMSFESNQYNIYSPERSTQNSPMKGLSPLRQSSKVVQIQENNSNSESGLIEDFEIEEELNSEEKREKAREVKNFFDQEDFHMESDHLELLSSSPKEMSMNDIVPVIQAEPIKKQALPSHVADMKDQLNLKKKERSKKKNPSEPAQIKRKNSKPAQKQELLDSNSKKKIALELENFKKHLENVRVAMSAQNFSKQANFFMPFTKKSLNTDYANSSDALSSKYQNLSARKEGSYLNTVDDIQSSKTGSNRPHYTLRSTQTSPNHRQLLDVYKDETMKGRNMEKTKLLYGSTNHIQSKNNQERKNSVGSPKRSFVASNIFTKLSGQKSKVLETQKKIKEICNHAQPQIKTKKKSMKSTQFNSLATQESENRNFNYTQPLKTETFISNSLIRIPELSSNYKEAFFKSLKAKHNSSDIQQIHPSCNSPMSRTISRTFHSSMNIKEPYANSAMRETVSSSLNSNYAPMRLSGGLSSPPVAKKYCPDNRDTSVESNKAGRNNSKKATKKVKVFSKKKNSIDGKRLSGSRKSFEFKLDLATLNKLVSASTQGSKNKINEGYSSGKVTTVNIETVTDTKTNSHRYSKGLSENRQKPGKMKYGYTNHY